MAIFRALALPCLAGAALLCGCAGPVRPLGYLDDYGPFNSVDKKDLKVRVVAEQDASLDKYYLTKQELDRARRKKEPVPSPEADGVDLSKAQPVLFVVARPEWRADEHLRKPEDEEDVLFTMRERMYRYLLREYPHPVRVRYAYAPEETIVHGYRILTVESAITDVNPGNGWLRYLIGYGAGTAVFQMEGRIYEGEGEDRTLVAEYATREDHMGYPNGFLNPSVMRTGYCMKYGVEEAIGNLSKEFRKAIPAARPAPESEVATAGH